MGRLDPQIAEVADDYLASLLAGDRVAALLVSREALAAGISLCELYARVFQPSLYEVGRLWERREIGVADEHLATAITRSVMELCANREKPLPSGPPTIITTCVGPEFHDVGLRMVSDCLEIEGWNTLYLGSNMPLEAILTLAVRYRVALVAASITMGRYAPAVYELAQALRQSAIGPTVKLLVGGQPFNHVPNLWHRVCADGTARDVAEAVAWVRHHVRRD
jgi:MerR family transcriptional regulator, light-induced transcriptional regulator